MENGCSEVFVMLVSSRSPKIIWRVVGLSGTVQVKRGNKDGRHGYVVTLFSAKGETTSTFYPFSGVTEELKAFLSDVSKSTLQCRRVVRLKLKLAAHLSKVREMLQFWMQCSNLELRKEPL